MMSDRACSILVINSDSGFSLMAFQQSLLISSFAFLRSSVKCFRSGEGDDAIASV